MCLGNVFLLARLSSVLLLHDSVPQVVSTKLCSIASTSESVIPASTGSVFSHTLRQGPISLRGFICAVEFGRTFRWSPMSPRVRVSYV